MIYACSLSPKFVAIKFGPKYSDSVLANQAFQGIKCLCLRKLFTGLIIHIPTFQFSFEKHIINAFITFEQHEVQCNFQ